jgi:hypothetical protein
LFAEAGGPAEHPSEEGTVPELASEAVPAGIEGAQASEAQPAADEGAPAEGAFAADESQRAPESGPTDASQPAAEGASDKVDSTEEPASAEQNPAEAGTPDGGAVPQSESVD